MFWNKGQKIVNSGIAGLKLHKFDDCNRWTDHGDSHFWQQRLKNFNFSKMCGSSAKLE